MSCSWFEGPTWFHIQYIPFHPTKLAKVVRLGNLNLFLTIWERFIIYLRVHHICICIHRYISTTLLLLYMYVWAHTDIIITLLLVHMHVHMYVCIYFYAQTYNSNHVIVMSSPALHRRPTNPVLRAMYIYLQTCKCNLVIVTYLHVCVCVYRYLSTTFWEYLCVYGFRADHSALANSPPIIQYLHIVLCLGKGPCKNFLLLS